MTHKINHADIKQWARDYNGEPFDGILCDPPYELGFMGKSWDSSGIAFDTEMWADLFKLLKPGGHLLAFSGSRTYHRMAVAIEDAGFEIRDMIEWVYGSGFPKSHNIGKNIEKIKVGGIKNLKQVGAKKGIKVETGTQGFSYSKEYVAGKSMGGKQISGDIPVYEINNEYNGYGTALKPAHEPICMARKPLDSSSICENCEGRGDVNIGAKECWVCNGTGKIKSKKLSVAENVLKYGTGGLNIDGTRVGTEDSIKSRTHADIRGGNLMSHKGNKEELGEFVQNPLGRFPANLIHDGSDEVEAVFPQTKSGAMNSIAKPNQYNTYGKMYERKVTNPASSGSASRFFYTAKASKSERNAGLEGFEQKQKVFNGQSDKSSTEIKDVEKRFTTQPVANHHPTVKPLSLTKYLATLIKPPTGGRLLVPFSGSGSEMIGALQAGWEYVEGVELTEEYIPIAEARIKYWVSKPQREVESDDGCIH